LDDSLLQMFAIPMHVANIILSVLSGDGNHLFCWKTHPVEIFLEPCIASGPEAPLAM